MLSRRQLLSRTACGFGSLALSGLASDAAADARSALVTPTNPLAPKPTHHEPRAKRMVFVYMQGGPSQVDTFDHKPALAKHDGQTLQLKNSRAMQIKSEKIMASPWKFARHGECGQWVSELFPEQAKIVDDLCLIHSMHTEGVAHGPSTLFLHTGATNLIRPSLGSWLMFGLGSENRNLPGFVTIQPPPTKGGPRNYSGAFLPAVYQGTAVGRAGTSAKEAQIRHLANKSMSASQQRDQLDLLAELNRVQVASAPQADPLEATIQSYELAYRMQNNAPGALDLSEESEATLKAYGIGEKATDDFGRQCLMARRLLERDVRFVQVNYADLAATPRWDQHSGIEKHMTHAKATDKPVAALVKDLKARGLLEDTIVWWGGEFGRTPFTQNTRGRDHNPEGFTVWLAGGGVKSGHAHGSTDEFGSLAVEQKVHMHDLHATLLHLLGLDHKHLTYRYAGRDFRLTDVHGRVVGGVIR